MTQATRQQVRDMYGFLEDMRERKYHPGDAKITDDRITAVLRDMSDPNGLMDAVIAKITRPDMGFDEFESISNLEEKASYNVFDTLRAIMLPSNYDVSHAIACSYKQDVPRLFEQLAIQIHPTADRAGAYRIAASVSYLEGDSAVRCKHFADMLFRVRPEDEMLKNLSAALIHGIGPERTTDPDGLVSERAYGQLQHADEDNGLDDTVADHAQAIR